MGRRGGPAGRLSLRNSRFGSRARRSRRLCRGSRGQQGTDPRRCNLCFMSLRAAALLAAASIAVAVAYPLVTSLAVKRREHSASVSLQAVAAAQLAFRASAGRGGYAATLISLTTPCPGAGTPTLLTKLDGEEWVSSGYRISLRAARGAAVTGLDCHGQPTSEDFVASARPIRVGVDGMRAMSVRADGRTYVFFDGVPPEEQDMAAGGLAMPLDALTRIP